MLCSVKRWSKEEDQVLQEKYGITPAHQIAKEIKRSVEAIHVRANAHLGLRGNISRKKVDFCCEVCGTMFKAYSRAYPIRFCSRKCYLQDHTWTNDEIEIIKRMYPTFPRKDICAALPRRSWQKIVDQAYILKIQRTRHFWSLQEDEAIIKYYTDASIEDIMLLLPYRTWDAVKAHARSLGVKGRFVPIIGVHEERVLNIFDRILQEKCIRNKKYDWLLSPKGCRMEIDGYYPENNLAVECQGEQHYFNKKVFYKTDEDFKYRCLLDKVKRKKIIAKGIHFLEIRYDEPITEEYLRKKVESVYAC